MRPMIKFAQREQLLSTIVIAGALTGGYLSMFYKVADPGKKLVITGPLIRDIKIRKKAILLPFQKYEEISLAPITIKTNVNSMTIENIPFILPITFTVEIQTHNELIIPYAKAFTHMSIDARNHKIESMVVDQIRSLTGAMKLEHLFYSKFLLNKNIAHTLHNHLRAYGLFVMNVDIEELVDQEGNSNINNMKQNLSKMA